MSNTSVLETRGIVKEYRHRRVVDQVNLQVHSSSVVGLLGPNGAGKTTTISILSTLFAPSSGDASIGGFSVTHDPMAVRRLIGVVPQELALYEELSARENLSFWGQMYGLSGKALHTRVDEVLEQIGLSDKAKLRIKTYSGGMKRRVNIGVGLLHRPSLLFMDEPTVGIDPQSRRAILDSVKELNRQGMTVLYTTHYMEEAQELSNRVGIIDHGKLIAIGTQAELTRKVGENDTLTLHLGESDAVSALLAAVQKIAGVLHADQTDHSLAVITPNASEILAPVIGAASSLGIKITSVDIQEPNLEAVFLSLTGRALRD